MGQSSRSKSPTQGGRSRSRPSSNDTRKKPSPEGDDERAEKKATSEPRIENQDLQPDPEPPQPVSSDDEEDCVIGIPKVENPKETEKRSIGGSEMSRLFAPYRTVGVLTSGRPFHLIPNQNSISAMLCMPIGERFQILSCERLQTVLVSQKVPSSSSTSPQHISHIVSDTTLSTSVVAHGSKHNPQQITLYKRAQARQTLHITRTNSWKIVDFLHLGRMKLEMSGEKEGKLENAAIVAAILSKAGGTKNEVEEDGVPVVGDSDTDGSNSDSDDIDAEATSNCRCEVVIMLASRGFIRVHKRISLTALPTFAPTVALHPSTYVNKIIIGGTALNKTAKGPSPALVLLNIRSGKVIHQFSCLHKKKKSQSGAVTTLEQSPVVDTIAVGTSHGRVFLINLRHDKMLFVLKHKLRDGSNAAVRITSISFRTDGSAQNYGKAPMAVGRADGTITVWDLNPPGGDDDGPNNKSSSNRMARTILTELHQVHAGGVSQVVYLPQEPLLLSIGKRSNAVLMHIFDNPDHSGRVLRQRKGHTAPPSRLRYLHPGASAGGGIMVNMADGTDASACQILSTGGLDRTLRVFSTARSALDKEYSQGKGLEKKAKKLGMDSTAELLLPPVTAMASCEARSRDWGDLVTIHKEHAMAYVWSSKRGAQWGPILRQLAWNVSAMKAPPPPTTHASSVAMSACGNFAVVGTKGGIIYKYNVQSGNTRGSYPADAGTDEEEEEGYKRKTLQAGDVKRTMKALEKKMKISNRASNLDKRDQDGMQEALVEKRRLGKLKQACHTGSSVTGIAVDSTNKTMISVASDAKLILWNFSTHAAHKKSPYQLPSPGMMLCHVRDSDLAAIALEDYTTLLFDCTALSTVRRFGAGGTHHSGPICDLAFSPDGRTLYTGSQDGTVRVWDVPTNTCVDWLGFETPPTSLAVSPTGEFLATAHAGKLGLSVWSDRSFYQTVNVNGAKELVVPFRMDEPRPLAEVAEKSQEGMPGNVFASRKSALEIKEDGEEAGADEDSKFPAVAKESGLVTLSNLPPAHWKNLFHLELIRERNKPKEPPKKPPSAPFFLQWRGGEPTGDALGQENGDAQPPSSAKDDRDDWKAAWSDDDGDEMIEEQSADQSNTGTLQAGHSMNKAKASGEKRKLKSSPASRILKSAPSGKKRKKIKHHRSRLANMLLDCSDRASLDKGRRFQEVTDHIATLGPSAIDVSLSSLCTGMHDLEEGLPLLRLACLWLIESCESRERYEAVNAYLHRFLHIHGPVIAGIEDSPGEAADDKEQALSTQEQEAMHRQIEEREELIELLWLLRKTQQSALDVLNGKLQKSLCVLHHFSRMI